MTAETECGVCRKPIADDEQFTYVRPADEGPWVKAHDGCASWSPDALLAERKRLLARIDEIDRVLREKHGIELACKPRRARPQRAAILAALADGPLRMTDIAARTGQGIHAVHQMAHAMVKQGVLERVSRGVVGLAKK